MCVQLILNFQVLGQCQGWFSILATNWWRSCISGFVQWLVTYICAAKIELSSVGPLSRVILSPSSQPGDKLRKQLNVLLNYRNTLFKLFKYKENCYFDFFSFLFCCWLIIWSLNIESKAPASNMWIHLVCKSLFLK